MALSAKNLDSTEKIDLKKSNQPIRESTVARIGFLQPGRNIEKLPIGPGTSVKLQECRSGG